MTSDPAERTPRWLALAGTAAGASATLMACWWGCVWLVMRIAGDRVDGDEAIVRVAAAAGAVAMLVTIPTARLLLRGAYASESLAVVMILLGVPATYCWLPQPFGVIHVF